MSEAGSTASDDPDLLARVPDGWGPKINTPTGATTLTSTGPGSIGYEAPVHYAIVLLTPQPGRETSLASDRTQTFSAPAGTLEIVPAGAEFKARWGVPKTNVLMAIAPARLILLAIAEHDAGTVELRPPKPGVVDQQACRIALLIQEAFVNGGTLSDIYMDTLISLFGIYLLRAHSSLSSRPAGPIDRRLTPREWRVVIDYMHDHMAERISLSMLASLARLSPSHFLSAFRVRFGLPPYRYLLRLRLERAERLIVETDLPLAAVAGVTGFSSQSHLTTAMRQHRAMTPGQLRQLKYDHRRSAG